VALRTASGLTPGCLGRRRASETTESTWPISRIIGPGGPLSGSIRSSPRNVSLPIEEEIQCNYNVIVNDLRFIWDHQKATSNKRKHGVTFSEAATVFTDENAVEYPDPDHSEEEERFIILGLSAGLRVLVVCYCFRHNQATIRIISARKATPKEIRWYGEKAQ